MTTSESRSVNSNESNPSRQAKARVILLTVGLGTMLSAMAGSTVTLALPAIAKEMGVAIGEVSWVMLAFLLSVTVLLLIAGRAGDIFGHARIYLTGFFLFGFSSYAAGASPDLSVLIVARVLQGISGAMIMATSPALLTTSIDPSQRGKALGILATGTYVGLTIGPSLGGALIYGLSWRWIFYLNIPISIIIFFMGLMFLPRSRKVNPTPFDIPGTLTLLIGLPLLLLAVGQGEQWGWLSTKTVVLALAGLSLLILFVRIEMQQRFPLLNLKLFSSAVFTGSVISALCNYIALFIQIILLPFYLMEALGVDAKEAGLVLTAQPFVMALVASPSGWLSDRIGSRVLAVVGMLVLTMGLMGLSSINSQSEITIVAFWLAVMGLGTGIFISPNSSALMGSAPKTQQGVAGSLLAVSRNFGMMAGVALSTTIFQAAGGSTGEAWQTVDFQAMRLTFLFAAGFSLLGAVSAFAKTKKTAG